MLNINELEKRWQIYKMKSYIPYAILFIIIIVFIIIFLITNKHFTTIKTFHVKKSLQVENNNTINEVKKIIKKVKKEILKNKITIKPIQQKTKQVILSPSLDFMSSMKHNSTSNYEEDNNNIDLIEKQKIDEQIIEDIEEVVQEEDIIKKNHVKIKRENKKGDINYVIKRFKKNNNPALSLFIAKKYYELGNYQQSFNYALITNGIDENIIPSWIIFTKSLVKLNKKDEAIKILKSYIKHSNSNQAKILLRNIISGKFK